VERLIFWTNQMAQFDQLTRNAVPAPPHLLTRDTVLRGWNRAPQVPEEFKRDVVRMASAAARVSVLNH
jgi:hypothetical protein